MANFNIDNSNQNSIASSFGTNAQNKTPTGNSAPLRTTNSQNPRVALTSYSISEMMQGGALYRPEGFVYDAFQQSLSSDLSILISSEGGADALLGGRRRLLAQDVLINQGFDDGIFTAESGMSGIVSGNIDGSPQTDTNSGANAEYNYSGSIPLNEGNENVEMLHPAVYERVAGMCSDSRCRGLLKVESAVRTYDEQVYLYNGYINGLPGFNEAANPNATSPGAYGLETRRGSWHMEQTNGYGYAVDFKTAGLPSDVYNALPEIGRDWGLVQTVPGEWWHFQPPLDENPLEMM